MFNLGSFENQTTEVWNSVVHGQRGQNVAMLTLSFYTANL